MLTSLNYRDLFIRIFVISITSLVTTLTTKSNRYDIHFRIRKPQELSSQVKIIGVANTTNIEEILTELKGRGAKSILVNPFVIDQKMDRVQSYSLTGGNSESLSIETKPDADGLLRRFRVVRNDIGLELPETTTAFNFRGPGQTFEVMSFYDIAESSLTFKDMILIIESSESTARFTTPVGILSETELLANLVDNSIEHRFIPNSGLLNQLLILLIILIITTALLLYLPSTLALVSTFIFGVAYLSFSLWVFDVFYIWTPLLGPIIQMVLTFLLVSNYKYVLNERTKWNLERESTLMKEVEEMKTNFLSLFSHDLKTPLAKIIGIADTLASKSHEPDLKAELGKIEESSRDLERYIKRILKMSQVQSKNISLNLEPVDINTLVEKSIEQNKYSATEKQISIRKDLAPLFMIDVDAALIQEVINNLIENAITYSPTDSNITVTSKEAGDFIRIAVKDEGPGVPVSAQQNIWEKHYRFDSSKGGYGLGLYLSRYVIDLHGGEVFLNSKEKMGSEFGFILPIGEG